MRDDKLDIVTTPLLLLFKKIVPVFIGSMMLSFRYGECAGCFCLVVTVLSVTQDTWGGTKYFW